MPTLTKTDNFKYFLALQKKLLIVQEFKIKIKTKYIKKWVK